MSTPDANQPERAARLHRAAITLDAHSDVLMPIADGKTRLGERFELPDPATWEPPLGWPRDAMSTLYGFTPHTAYFQTMGLYDLPRFLEGGLTVESYAIYIENHDLERALQRGLEMVYWLNREAAENDAFELVTSVADIHRIKDAGKTGGILALEGFEPIAFDLKLLDVFYALGLRMASLTHSRRNSFADGTQMGAATGGLTVDGKRAIRRMNELGIVIDLAHLNQPGCWEVLELSDAPVVLSHTSPRRFFPTDPRTSPLYPDIVQDRARELLEAIAANGGIVGIIAYNQPDLAAYLDDIDEVIRAVGPDHVGLGTDFFGIERAPTEFAGIHELPNVTRGLVERGYSDEVILKVLGGNFLRVFQHVWR